jgi:uncharacterized protein (TIGR03382 family)
MTLLLPTAILITATAASGFSLDTVATVGCHERITANALKRSGWPLGQLAPTPADDDRVLAQNVQFHAPADADAWTLGLLIGVRDNDLGGSSPVDLPNLAAVQNGQHEQHDHCLRELGDKGADGDMKGLAACRAYIVDQVTTAIGDGDAPDLQQTEPHRVDLAYGDRQLPISRYAFHLGNASHALEDSFAHTFRTDDLRAVVSVFSYIGPNLDSAYEADVDGYPHQSSMDSCDEADPAANARAQAATTAVAELYDAVNQPGDRAARLERVNAVLDSWLAYQPGCTSENEYCGHVHPATGCSAAGGVPMLAALLGVLLRRRRMAVKGLALASMLGAAAASAQTMTPALSPPADDVAQEVPGGGNAPMGGDGEAPQAGVGPAVPAGANAPAVDSAAPTTPVAPDFQRWGLRLATSVSIDNPSLALALGARFNPTRRLSLGVDVELAPWFDPISGHAALGTLDAFATAAFAWLQLGPVSLRSSLSAGTSVLLFDAMGAQKGSVGVFVGTSPVQIAVRLPAQLQLELSPEVTVAVPELKGVPLAYRQYRATIALQRLF